jgi:Tat protein translocase TatC
VKPPAGGGGPPQPPEGPEDDVQLTLIDHLRELRKRIISSAWAIVIGFIATYAVHDRIMSWVLAPVYQAAPEGTIIALTHPVEGFFVNMRVAGYAAVFLTSPVILWQFYSFIAPGLYRRERRLIVPFVSLGVVFFTGGGLFARYIILPFALEVLVAGYVANDTTIGVAAQTPSVASFTNVTTSAAPSGASVTFGEKHGAWLPSFLSGGPGKPTAHGVKVTVTTPGPAGTAKVLVSIDGTGTPDVGTGQAWSDPGDSGLTLDFSTQAGNFQVTDVFTNSGLLEHNGSGKATAFVAHAPGTLEANPLTVTLTIARSGSAAGMASSDSPATGLGTAIGTLTLADSSRGPRTFPFVSGSNFPTTFTDNATGTMLEFSSQAGPFLTPDTYSLVLQPPPKNGLRGVLSLEETSDFVLMVLMAFGIIFELPLVLTLLARIGVVSSTFLAKYRRHAIVANTVIAAVVTPTGDAFNLALMAIPLVIFYELGIIGARIMEKQRKVGDGLRMKDDDEDPPPPPGK